MNGNVKIIFIVTRRYLNTDLDLISIYPANLMQSHGRYICFPHPPPASGCSPRERHVCVCVCLQQNDDDRDALWGIVLVT